MTNNKTMEEKKQNPTNATVPASIIIAPRIESLDITIVMGDQRSSYMNFNGGEACVEDPYDDGSGVDEFDKDYDGDGLKDYGAAKVMDEIDRNGCAECEFTDCVDHPLSQEAKMQGAQMRMKGSAQKPQGSQQQGAQRLKNIQQPKNTQQQPQGIKQTPKIIVTEGEAALEGMPELFKLIFRLLNDAGRGVEEKRYEQKDEYERREEQSDE